MSSRMIQCMTTTQKYTLLAATVAFREAYKNLQAVYDKTYDADFSAQYPLGPIDIFDKNTRDGLVAWLNYHATELINAMPDKVINPTCIECLRKSKDKYPKLNSTGTCTVKPDDAACFSYPYVTFDADMIKAFLIRQTYDKTIDMSADDIKKCDESALRMLYYRVLQSVGIKEISQY